MRLHFQGYPAVRPELDLVEPDDQLTHEISLQEEIDPEITLGMSNSSLLQLPGLAALACYKWD